MSARLVWVAPVAALVILVAGCGSTGDAGPAQAGTSTTSAPKAMAWTEVPGSTPTGPAAFLGAVRTVPVGSITMDYRQFGSGPNLVIVAGEASPMSFWPLSTLAALAKRWRVTMYDNRGLGATTDDLSRPLTMDRMADDLVGLDTALGLVRPAVFGWSTGGEIALQAAIRHPNGLGRIAITGAMPAGHRSIPTPPAAEAIFDDPNASPVALLGLLFGTDTTAESAYVGDLAKVPQTIVTAATTQRYTDCENAYLAGPDQAAALHKLPIPVLVMNGTDDQLVRPQNAQVIAGLIPHAQLSLEPGGHAWFVEHPDDFITALGHFVPQR